MKNLDRGVVIGQRTFGKGSVQMLFSIQPPVKLSDRPGYDEMGLKLTTSQYLTPGDISIQGVGVTPDIELVRTQVVKEEDESWIQLQRSEHRRTEADNQSHLENPTQYKGAKPEEVITYLYEPRPGDPSIFDQNGHGGGKSKSKTKDKAKKASQKASKKKAQKKLPKTSLTTNQSTTMTTRFASPATCSPVSASRPRVTRKA